MKNLTLAITLMLGMTSFGQLNYDEWETNFYVDDFGDPTEESYSRVFCQGTFSNSATSNSELTVKVLDDGEYITISLYEYNRGSGARVGDYDGSLGEIQYKLSNGTTGTLKCHAPKSGGIFFSRKNYTAFKTLLTNNPGTTISFAVNEFDCDYGKCSSWIFKMVTPQLKEE